MAEYDLRTGLSVTPAINPISNSAGANGVSINTKGYESVTFVAHIGAIASGTIVFTVEHADDNGSGSAGTFGAVGSDDIVGTFPTFNTANTSGAVAYRGKKQWVRLVSSGTYTTCVHSATCVLGHPKRI